MNIQNIFDSTTLSDLNGRLQIKAPPHFQQGDYTSLLSVRAVEDIFVVDGKITITNPVNSTTKTRTYNHQQYNTMFEFMEDFTANFGMYLTIEIDAVNKRAFRINFKDTYKQSHLKYEGNVENFIGRPTMQDIILDGTMSLDNNAKEPTAKITAEYASQKFSTVHDFVEYTNKVFENVIRIDFDDQKLAFKPITYLDNSYNKGNFKYTGNINQYLTFKQNLILNNEKLGYSSLSIQYLQIKCDKLQCGLNSYVFDPDTNQQRVQFSSSVLQVLCPNQMSYQSKNMDLHIKLLESMPLDFYITDQDNNAICLQYILQMRFYKQEYFFQQQSDSGVTAIHQKQQIFVFLTDKFRSFKINQKFDQVALCQAYGNIGPQPATSNTYVISYVYDLKINNYKFDILHAYERNIENINSSIFVWLNLPPSCLLNFELTTAAIEYTQDTMIKQETVKKDQQPNILLRLFIK
ncbi:Hypothetical_protein [Hexamita inflata]|uniref:Hypothetical_protein n=1 Tax=Hexamita inflata TaxID=28002 RepID=A0AA86UI98_9EUKA|nr:Hypothetical protein HINF_LOCUS44519 [Hexamita inflata]